MRHNKKVNHLTRTSAHRKALMKNMAIALITHERISTTLAKAKSLKPFVEKMITLGKRGDLGARRNALRYLNHRPSVQKLFQIIAPRFSERKGGYTRIYHTAPRMSDDAKTAIIEIIR